MNILTKAPASLLLSCLCSLKYNTLPCKSAPILTLFLCLPAWLQGESESESEHTEQLIKWSWKLWRKGSWFIIFQVKQISDFYFYFFFQMGIGSRQASNAFGLLIMLLRAPMHNVCCVQKAFLFIDVQNRSIRVRLYRFMNIAIILVIHRGYNTIYSLFISFYTYSIKFTMSHGERGRCSGIERQS